MHYSKVVFVSLWCLPALVNSWWWCYFQRYKDTGQSGMLFSFITSFVAVVFPLSNQPTYCYSDMEHEHHVLWYFFCEHRIPQMEEYFAPFMYSCMALIPFKKHKLCRIDHIFRCLLRRWKESADISEERVDSWTHPSQLEQWETLKALFRPTLLYPDYVLIKLACIPQQLYLGKGRSCFQPCPSVLVGLFVFKQDYRFPQNLMERCGRA